MPGSWRLRVPQQYPSLSSCSYWIWVLPFSLRVPTWLPLQTLPHSVLPATLREGKRGGGQASWVRAGGRLVPLLPLWPFSFPIPRPNDRCSADL